MEEQTKLEQLEIRIQNLRVIIQVTEFEIAELLEEVEHLKKPNKIGFKFNKEIDEQDKKRPNKHTPSNS